MTETWFYVEDANGTVYKAEQAGVWDDPDGGVLYEDEDRPEGAVPLYRLTVQES